MKVNKKLLPKSEVELTIELSQEELKPYLIKTAEKISKNAKIPGFRPGKASYDIVKLNVGEMTIYEKAFDAVISETIFQIIDQEKLEIVCPPKIDVEKMAPGNPLVYRATVSVLPKIKLTNWQKIGIKRKKINISDEQVNKVLNDLQKMQTKEVLVNREAKNHDKIVIDMDISKDGVPIEGGQTKNHAIYLDEDYYIPGLKEKLIGSKKDEEKTFSLEFPKTHYQKHLAGQKTDFKIKIKSVFELQYPELNDEFAKNLGKETLNDLKNQIKKNLELEEKDTEEKRLEREMFEKIIEKTKFDDIPDCLTTKECRAMIEELENGVLGKGLKFEDYLKNIKKTENDLMLDFVPEAIKRVKVSLIIKEIAEQEKIKISEQEIDEEIKKTIKLYSDHPEIHKNIHSEESLRYLKNILTNKKAVELLKSVIVK